MNRGDKLIRRTGYAAVAVVSAVAAWISYWHAVGVIGKHGQTGTSGHVYPATIDGLIIAASMVLLDSARNREKPPRLAWWLVGAGIFATLAANVLDGISFGVLGSIIAAWPAAAFVGAYEMIMVLIRSGARRAEVKTEPIRPAQEIQMTPSEVAQLERELDEVPRPMPKLAQTMRAQPPWEDAQFFAPAPEPTPARHAAPVPPGVPNHYIDPEPVFMPDPPGQLAGSVSVRSPLARLDRKVPVDERVTGTMPAITD